MKSVQIICFLYKFFKKENSYSAQETAIPNGFL